MASQPTASQTKFVIGIVVAGVVAFFALLTVFASFTVVPAGHVKVTTSFGSVIGQPLEPGLHIIAPWQSTHKINVQTQETMEAADVPTKEGATVHLEASILYSVKKDKANDLYTSVGINYKEVVIMPQFRSAMRGVTVKYKAEDLYTAHRAEIESDMEKMCRGMLEERGIHCEKVLLRAMILPPIVKNAIERKLAAQQDAAAMEFVILKENQEAERKRSEAKGIADSQHIIQGTLTNAYLRYLWIKGLQEAARHSQAVIYVPTGHDGIPFFKEASIPEKKK
jgi:prohibitin 1